MTTTEPVSGWVRIPNHTIGIVERRFGRHPGDVYSVKFLGSMGTQAAVLGPNTRRWLNPLLYKVRYSSQTHVPDGTIGLVNARAGRVRPPGRTLGDYVETCDYFQDGEAFLRDGGEQGRQLGYLPGGAHYSINPELFEVLTVETPELLAANGLTPRDLRQVVIPEGVTGVVVTLDGEPAGDALGPAVPGHHHFQRPWVFRAGGGLRGVQREFLGVGKYAVNPWFAQVVKIPTRELTLEWSKRSNEKPDNFDAALEQIELNIQGYRLHLDMSQTLKIPPEAAPHLVKRFGQGNARSASQSQRAPVQRFVGKVLGATVAGYFIEVAGKYQVMDFIVNFGAVRAQLQDKVRNALDDWGVEAGETILEQLTTADPRLNELRQRLADLNVRTLEEVREQDRLRAEKVNQQLKAEIEEIQIRTQGAREVEVLRRQIELIGPNQVVLERFVERMAGISVPQFIGGGDMAERMLSMMPLAQAQDILRTLVQQNIPGDGPAQAVGPGEQPPAVPPAGDGGAGWT